MRILEVTDLVKTFKAKRRFLKRSPEVICALNGLSFNLDEGETLGLVGESGCGKSTLARCLLKLYPVDSGHIVYRGRDITRLNPSQMKPLRCEMQMIFQDPSASLNPRMKIGNALMEPLVVHNIVPKDQRRDRVTELLNLVGLHADAMGKYPHEFSGGQRQRIGIARALTVNPRLIVADEAVSALDISIQAQIINLMTDLKARFNLSMIFIAHDLKVVEHIADRILVMYLGKIMEVIHSDEIKNARHPYTKCLLSAVPVPDPRAASHRQILKGEIPSPANLPAGCVFHTRCPIARRECAQHVPGLREIKGGHQVACGLV
ncbi:MAG: ATP-binding cassette domain-containing protein [Deltaproteobacteria bacterium]|nr:ATP-binding cassette domain-containing protein [Deltaproteobacteria bacterium]